MRLQCILKTYSQPIGTQCVLNHHLRSHLKSGGELSSDLLIFNSQILKTLASLFCSDSSLTLLTILMSISFCQFHTQMPIWKEHIIEMQSWKRNSGSKQTVYIILKNIGTAIYKSQTTQDRQKKTLKFHLRNIKNFMFQKFSMARKAQPSKDCFP